METCPAIKVLAGVVVEVCEMGLEGVSGDVAGNKLQWFCLCEGPLTSSTGPWVPRGLG